MKSLVDIYLFRHGEALNNVNSHLITGRGNEVPLVESGENQARLLGLTLAETDLIPDLVFSSPANRARRTGELTLQAMGIITEIVLDERLHEQHTGDWTGHLAQDIFTDEMVKTIEASGKNFRSPNGESMIDVGERMLEWANSITPHEGDKLTVFGFTHGGSIRCLASQILDWTHAQTYKTKPGNTSVGLFRKLEDGIWEVPAIGVNAKDLAG